MHRHRAMQSLVRLCLSFTLVLAATLPGYAAEPTQRDWMLALVDALGWSYGLPDEPKDQDYMNILTGKRTLRYEAEEVYAKDEDNVSVMAFRNFGSFGGEGWLSGGREPTAVHLRFTLPLGGTYRLTARMRRAGLIVTVDGNSTKVDAENVFTDVAVGEYRLQAGGQEVVVTLPPGGALDSITLTAPNLAPIVPDDGWRPDLPLDWEAVHTTLLQLLRWADIFPETPPLLIEAESLTRTDALLVDIPHLGMPSGGKWLRAGPVQVEVSFPMTLADGGFYDLVLRAMGKPVDISVGGLEDLRIEGKPYLEDYIFPSRFFMAGDNNVVVKIPSGGGVDLLTIKGRRVDPTLAATLFGLDEKGPPTARDLDTITTLLAALGVER